ncbi:thioredoxin fold domain-containing protein [Nioella aestuarii]|uniref:thioredoxin fold domain-containing protein n=1 Tax=Nioella aestuarii TaxID=1662864 RepID=UPI003D7F5E58
MTARIFATALATFVGLTTFAAADTALVMVEQDGCIYCSRWHADVGEIYPLTEFAETAPLRIVDLQDLPEDLTFAARVVFTPTFVLFEGGQEIARAEGYVGDELFWMQMELLSRQLTEHRAAAVSQ